MQFRLDDFRCLTMAGPDARAFAQAQFTVSVDDLVPERWSPLAWCDPKGRVLAFMMARSGEDDVELVLPAIQADDIRKRLTMYTIGRQVTLAEPQPVAGSFDADDSLPVFDNDPPRYLGLNPDAPAAADSVARWRQLDLCRGLPWLDAGTSGRHLPQWLGLETLGGLSYSKGCYPGQEVVARVHYRGSVKYGLYGLQLAGDAARVEPHTDIRDQTDKSIGHWLRGPNADATTIGLAVVRTGLAENAVVFVGEDGLPARVTAPKSLC